MQFVILMISNYSRLVILCGRSNMSKVIMDMNGVLMKRGGSGNQHVTMRPHLEEFLKVLSELSESFSVAVWSSMMMHNLEPMVNNVFGEFASSLQFIWDAWRCYGCRSLRKTEKLNS